MQAFLIHRGAKHLALFLCVLFVCGTSSAQKTKIGSDHASSDHPLWRVDLQSLGYPQKNPDLQRRRNFANFDTISFVSDDIIAATFITREDIPNLQRREDPNHLRPYRLHAVFLDAATGKILHTLDWPTDDPNAGLFPRREGGFLLLTVEHIVSYSADWTPLKELPLSELVSDNASIRGISESPSGRSLVIKLLHSPSPVCYTVRTDTLDSSQLSCGLLDIFTASDNGIVAPEKLPSGGDLLEKASGGAFLQYGASVGALPANDRRNHNLSNTGDIRTVCSPCTGMPQFVNNDKFVVYSTSYLSIVDRNGKVSFTEFFNAFQNWIDEFGRPVRSAANGQRFVLATNVTQDRSVQTFGGSRDIHFSLAVHMSTGDLPAELPYDVKIYDLPSAKWIFTLQINADHLQKIWGLALSPNGNKLVIDSGGVIHVFALPPSSATDNKR